MSTLIQTAVSSISHEMLVQALSGTVAHWFLYVEHDGKQFKNVL